MAQEYLWECYTRVALQRGVHAEAHQRIFPKVAGAFA